MTAEEGSARTDIGVLLGLRDVRGLAQVRRVTERLADGRGVLVDVLLFDVRGATLELLAGRAACDEAVAADDTDSLAVREHVEERRLAGAGRSHERRKLARANVTEDVVEQLALTARDGDGVAARSRQECQRRASTETPGA